MKFMNKMLVVILLLVLTAFLPAMAYAEGAKDHAKTKEIKTVSQENVLENDTVTGGAIKGKPNKNQKAWKVEKKEVLQEKKEIQSLFGEVGEKLDDLESKLEAAETNGADITIINDLKTQIVALKEQKIDYKDQINLKIEEMKQIVRNKYTEDELNQLDKVSQSISQLSDVKVIPVENIFFVDKDVKFDTPPVIKQGRTLIPVRAIVESMGASVNYNSELQIVTILKDDKTIKFYLSDSTVYVNNEKVEIDVPAEIINNRTLVPMRFIAENFGMNVEWNNETNTAEISE